MPCNLLSSGFGNCAFFNLQVVCINGFLSPLPSYRSSDGNKEADNVALDIVINTGLSGLPCRELLSESVLASLQSAVNC